MYLCVSLSLYLFPPLLFEIGFCYPDKSQNSQFSCLSWDSAYKAELPFLYWVKSTCNTRVFDGYMFPMVTSREHQNQFTLPSEEMTTTFLSCWPAAVCAEAGNLTPISLWGPSLSKGFWTPVVETYQDSPCERKEILMYLETVLRRENVFCGQFMSKWGIQPLLLSNLYSRNVETYNERRLSVAPWSLKCRTHKENGVANKNALQTVTGLGQQILSGTQFYPKDILSSTNTYSLCDKQPLI